MRWDYVPAEETISRSPSFQDMEQENAPQPVAMLWKDCQQQMWSIARPKVFHELALKMADFDDDAEQIVPFQHYYPVYQDMTIAQMRSYFTLRHQLRLGKHPEMSTSYLFVYIYETLMQVGVGSPEEGYEILQELASAYSDDAAVKRYLKLWMRDYVVYYDLTSHIDECFADEQSQDHDASILANYAKADDGALWQVVSDLSAYPITKAALYRHEPEAVRAITVKAIRNIAPYLEHKVHHRFDKVCLELKRKSGYYRMFYSAVFYDPDPPRTREVTVTARRKFTCEGGLWKYYMDIRDGKRKSKVLGTILREVDRQLRRALHTGPALNEKYIDPELGRMIASAASDFLKAREEASRPKVVIDARLFNDIRSDAAVVQQALLTEEEKDEGQSPTSQQQDMPKEEEEPALECDDSPFSPDERQYLSLLLQGDGGKNFLHQQHILQGVITESINEKALDLIGDILLDDDGLIEDYKDDIKQWIEA